MKSPEMGMEPLIHEAKVDLDWNESYYFVFYDKQNHLGGMSRLGFKPNKKEGSIFLILFLPDGSAALYTSTEKIDDEQRKRQTAAGHMTCERLATGEWRHRFKGNVIVAKNPEDLPQARQHPELVDRIVNVVLDLCLVPINETYEYSKNMTPESRELGRKSGDEHWEQIGKVTGRITIGEAGYQIQDVIGQRDHTHGVRDWTGVGNWLYYVVWFDEGLCLNPAAIVADDGRVSSGGFIFKNGKNIPIKTIRVMKQEFRANNYPVSSKIEIIDAHDRRHVLQGKTGPLVPMPFVDNQGKLSILTQAFGDFIFDGRQGGYGGYENLRRIK